MGRRVLAFFLGMIFGIIFLLGSLALGIYLAITVIKPSDISADASTYMGDLADMSLLDMVQSVQQLYTEQLGLTDENGDYFSLGDFLDNYNINCETAFGIALPQSVLDVPVFEYFNEGGVDNALQQISVATLPAIINMFATEEGGYISAETMEKLDAFTMKDLFDGEKGITYVFDDVRFADLLANSFPAADSDNKFMWAIGQGRIGRLYGALSGSESLFMQLKEDGGLSDLGSLPVTEVLGGSSGVLGAILGDASLGSMVDENGALNFDQVLEKTYVGSLLACIRNEIEDVSGYTEVELEGGTILAKTENGKTVFVKADGDKHFEVVQYCTVKDIEHVHDASCYDFAWYNSIALAAGHSNCKENELIAEDGHHSRISGIYKALINLYVSDLMGGSSAVIMEGMQNVTISEMMDGKVSGIMANFKDMTIHEMLNGGVDEIYLGSFIGYTRTTATKPQEFEKLGDVYLGKNGDRYVMSEEGADWYNAKLICENTDASHKHSRSCYSYEWMNGTKPAKGLMAKLSESKLGELSNLNDIILSSTVSDVLGDNLTGIMAELKDTPLKNLSSEMNNVYLGAAMNFYRKSVDVAGYSKVDGISNLMQKDGQFAKSDDGKKWYYAELDCDKDHTHTAACYAYVWYKNAARTIPVTGVQKCFVNSKLGNLSSTMDNLTLKKLGVGGNTILNAMGDVPLMALNTQMKVMKLGVVFDFVEDKTSGVSVWYERCKTGCGHSAGQHVRLEGETGYFTPAKGINAKMANMTLSNLMTGQGMTSIVSEFTVREMQDSGILSFTEQDEYKLDVIFDSTGECSLADYFMQRATNSALTAKQYYQSKHGDDQTTRGEWKDVKLSVFFKKLLQAI